MGRNLYRTLAIIFAVVLLSVGMASSASPTYYGTLVGNAALTPAPAPTGYSGYGVIAQATAQPTMQPGNINVTGSVQAAGGFTGNLFGAIDNSVPAPQAGATLVFSGDSITWGLGTNNALLGCNSYTFPSPCFADQVTSHYSGTTEVNDGIPGSCMEATTDVGSLCNYPATSGSGNPLISRYTTTMLPYAGNNKNWFFIMIGINDIGSATGRGDLTVNVVTYKADLATVVAALEAAGTPANQIVLSQITYAERGAASPSMTFQFNAAVAEVAQTYHTRLAMTYQAMAYCPNRYSGTPPGCLYDSVHPDNLGSANLATQMENASYVQAISGQATNNIASYLFSGLSVPNPITFPTYIAGSASQVWIGQDGQTTAGAFFNVPTGSTSGWRWIVNNGTVTAMTLGPDGSLKPQNVSFPTYGPGAGTLVWFGRDNGTTAGAFFNVPTSSTNGWQWIVNNGTTTAATLSTAGLFQPSASIQFPFNGVGSASKVWIGQDGQTTAGAFFNVPTGSTSGWRWIVNNGTVTAMQLSAAGVPTFYNHTLQSSTCLSDCKVTLSSGTATWTFGTAFSVSPACTATPEGAPSSGAPAIYTTITATSATVTSTLSTDNRVIDVHCGGYPN